ncbi:hypothetical protein [Christensenella minuta]|uniref:hypothetical protein n=1 Tax=Christensenella minuta TaxID=626937 RepID=UPI0021586ED9|nr:hypothetical protein [Christensenella minuta]
MTWKEYKQTRLTARERAILANHIEEVSQSINDGKMILGASGTLRTLIVKLVEDEGKYMIAGMLRALTALDGIDVRR